MSPSEPPKRQLSSPKHGRKWIRKRYDPLNSVLLTIPVFLTYHLGILLIDLRNGVDLVSTLTFQLLQSSLLAYVLVTLGGALGIAVTVFVLRRQGKIEPAQWINVLLESLVWAVLMMFSVGWLTEHLVDWQVGPHPMSFIERLVMAAGAGFHEELVFRVFLFGGGTWLLTKTTSWSASRCALLSALVSSVVFSAIHYTGNMGDSFTLVSFTFRTVAGLFLAGIYRFRGFAVSVYTHTFYDLIVFFLV